MPVTGLVYSYSLITYIGGFFLIVKIIARTRVRVKCENKGYGSTWFRTVNSLKLLYESNNCWVSQTTLRKTYVYTVITSTYTLNLKLSWICPHYLALIEFMVRVMPSLYALRRYSLCTCKIDASGIYTLPQWFGLDLSPCSLVLSCYHYLTFGALCQEK